MRVLHTFFFFFFFCCGGGSFLFIPIQASTYTMHLRGEGLILTNDLALPFLVNARIFLKEL